MTSCEAGSTDCHFTCPKGGTWFVCTSEPYFVGCCASDPCTNTTTPACPDLYPASFNSSIYDKFSPNDCIDNPSTDWYTCDSTSPTFLGCCKSNPCGDGCPSDALLPAAWSTAVAGQFQLFLDGASISTTSVVPSSTSTSTSTSSATAVPSSKSSGLSSGAIVGIAIGGAVVLSIILGVLFLRRRHQRHKYSSAAGEGQGIFAGEYGAYNGPSSPHQDSHVGSPDPTVKYTSGSSAGFTLSSSSPLSSEGHRPISEIDSKSHDYVRPNHGLHIFGAPTVQQVIPELHSDHAEIYELDGIRR